MDCLLKRNDSVVERYHAKVLSGALNRGKVSMIFYDDPK